VGDHTRVSRKRKATRAEWTEIGLALVDGDHFLLDRALASAVVRCSELLATRERR
jgi:surfactin synthase thioesterase subunit